jgi:hypothetical protein
MAIPARFTLSFKEEDGAQESTRSLRPSIPAFPEVSRFLEAPKTILKQFPPQMESFPLIKKTTSETGPESSLNTVPELVIKAPKKALYLTREALYISEATTSR